MNIKQNILIIVLLYFVYLLYKFQDKLMYVFKSIGFFFAILTLVIPRYIDNLPEYVYLFYNKKK